MMEMIWSGRKVKCYGAEEGGRIVGAMSLSRAERRSNAQVEGLIFTWSTDSASVVPEGEAGYVGVDVGG